MILFYTNIIIEIFTSLSKLTLDTDRQCEEFFAIKQRSTLIMLNMC